MTITLDATETRILRALLAQEQHRLADGPSRGNSRYAREMERDRQRVEELHRKLEEARDGTPVA